MLIGEVCRAKLWNMCEWGDRLVRLHCKREQWQEGSAE